MLLLAETDIKYILDYPSDWRLFLDWMHVICRTSPVWSFANASTKRTPRCQTGKLNSDFFSGWSLSLHQKVLRHAGLEKKSSPILCKGRLKPENKSLVYLCFACFVWIKLWLLDWNDQQAITRAGCACACWYQCPEVCVASHLRNGNQRSIFPGLPEWWKIYCKLVSDIRFKKFTQSEKKFFFLLRSSILSSRLLKSYESK